MYVSVCFVYLVCFSKKSENEPNWDKEIEEDVKEECAKFGKVVHGAVDKESEVS